MSLFVPPEAAEMKQAGSLSQLSLGESQGPPRIGRHSVAGLAHSGSQAFAPMGE